MDKLRLRNYRCFDDTDYIELKPITLLLGANSSGKSSFIKFFPLLQQSLETRVDGLFLWDGQYVDFKNFKNTVKNGVGEITIDYFIGDLELQNYYGRRNQRAKDVIVSMTLCEKEEYYDYLKELSIFLNGICFKYLFSKDGKTCSIEANGIKSDDYPDEKILLEFDNNLLPSLSFEVKREDFTFVSAVSQEALSEIGTFWGKEEKTGLDFLLGDRDSELFSYDYQKNKDDLKKKKPRQMKKLLKKWLIFKCI